MVTELENHGAE